MLNGLKDRQNQTFLEKDGKTPWTHAALGYAFGGNPYTDRDGYTPSGVYRIDGVMPEADDIPTFGKYRRLILNFIDSSAGESFYKLFLPESHHNETWWKEAVVGRDMGRNLFRIHGSGRSNPIPWSTFKPFVATRGCVSQREGEFKGAVYKDQRLLLDALMKAQGLDVKSENELKIISLLYLVEIDDKEGSVHWKDLKALGLQ